MTSIKTVIPPITTAVPQDLKTSPPPPLPANKCEKCGMELSGCMGYVCGSSDCPVFLKVIC